MHRNIRAPSKEILCDMVLKAWVSNDIIEKSFLIAKPEDIECLKK